MRSFLASIFLSPLFFGWGFLEIPEDYNIYVFVDYKKCNTQKVHNFKTALKNQNIDFYEFSGRTSLSVDMKNKDTLLVMVNNVKSTLTNYITVDVTNVGTIINTGACN